MPTDLRPLLTILGIALAFWLRKKINQAKVAAQQQNPPPRAVPRTPAPAFPEVVPMEHRLGEQYRQPPEEEPQTRWEPLPAMESRVVEPAFDKPSIENRQSQPAPKTLLPEHRPGAFQLPRFNANTLVQAVIAKEILTRPPAAQRRGPGQGLPQNRGTDRPQ